MNQITLLDYFAGQILNGMISEGHYATVTTSNVFDLAQEMVEESNRRKAEQLQKDLQETNKEDVKSIEKLCGAYNFFDVEKRCGACNFFDVDENEDPCKNCYGWQKWSPKP